jgi:hypothetical protein
MITRFCTSVRNTMVILLLHWSEQMRRITRFCTSLHMMVILLLCQSERMTRITRFCTSVRAMVILLLPPSIRMDEEDYQILYQCTCGNPPPPSSLHYTYALRNIHPFFWCISAQKPNLYSTAHLRTDAFSVIPVRKKSCVPGMTPAWRIILPNQGNPHLSIYWYD